MPQHHTPGLDQRRQGFENSERLRELLTRLHADGPAAWRRDPEAAALMRHAADKYAALARKHGLDPWEAAGAAFEAMRTASVRRADDPWAVITRAVQITCIAENRANGLLCSVHQARRPRYSSFHDAERFSDRENPLTDYHPAFRADPFAADDDDAGDEVGEEAGCTGWSPRLKTRSRCCAGTGGSRRSRGPRSSASVHASPSPCRVRARMSRCDGIVTPAHSSTSPPRPGTGYCESSWGALTRT